MIADITDDKIKTLIECPKVITMPPRKQFILEKGSLRNDMKLKAKDADIYFSVFMRQLDRLVEQFSIGLIWANAEEDIPDIILLRCNGMHGHNKNIPTHRVPHIHLITADDILNQIYAPHAKGAEQTSEYVTFQAAISYFIKRCNILDVYKYFPYTEDTLF